MNVSVYCVYVCWLGSFNFISVIIVTAPCGAKLNTWQIRKVVILEFSTTFVIRIFSVRSIVIEMLIGIKRLFILLFFFVLLFSCDEIVGNDQYFTRYKSEKRKITLLKIRVLHLSTQSKLIHTIIMPFRKKNAIKTMNN